MTHSMNLCNNDFRQKSLSSINCPKQLQSPLSDHETISITICNDTHSQIPPLFKNVPDIIVNELPSNSTNRKAPARKRRKLSAKSTATKSAKTAKSKSPNPPTNDIGNTQIEVWRSKSYRTPSELHRLQSAVDCNESMISISNVLSREVHEMMEILCSLKMALSLKIPPMMEGNNFGVEIQDGVIDDLCRAENGALDAASQIANYYQIRAKV